MRHLLIVALLAMFLTGCIVVCYDSTALENARTCGYLAVSHQNAWAYNAGYINGQADMCMAEGGIINLPRYNSQWAQGY